MATNPILLDDGTAVTDFDQDVIEVTGAGGQKVRVARAAAPPQLQQAVQRAEMGAGGPASLVPSAPGGGAFGNIDINVPAPGVNIPKPGPGAAVPAAPSAPEDVAPMPMLGASSSPMAAAQAELSRLRSMPQVTMGGGGERKTTSVTRMPEQARADVLDAQTPIDEAQAERELAIEEMGSAEEKALGQVSQLHAEQGRNIQGEIDAQQALQQSHQQRWEAEQKKLEELNRQAQVEISPDRYWKEKGTGNKILAAISMAVGAFVHARSEGRVQNTPMQLIQSAIERDIGAQVENRNRAERDVARQGSLMAMLADKYESDIDRRNAALVLANESVAKQIDGVAAGLQSEQAKAKAMELSAQLRQANAQRAQELGASTAGSETVTTQQVPGGLVKTQAGKQYDALAQRVYGPDSDFDPETHVPAAYLITGEHRAANTKEEAKELREKATAVQELLRMSAQMQEISKRGKASPQASRELDSLRSSYVVKTAKAEKLGALDAGTTDIVEKQLGPKGTDLTTITDVLPRTDETVRAGFASAIRNQTRPINPDTVPGTVAWGRSGATGAATAPPPTRPLAMEGTE
jgi:hypothetical protein